MTLVIIQRTDKQVSFSSDSRISFGNDGYFDKGIKIFNAQLRIKSLAKQRSDIDKYEHQLQYGLAVVGSSTNAYTVKDSIAEILLNITYLTNLSDYSIIGIGNLVYDIYKEVSEELKPILRENGLCEILLGGYCLSMKKVRVLRFYPYKTETNIEYRCQEVQSSDGMSFFGSGRKVAEKIFKEDDSLSALQIIKRVILSGEDKAVGGVLQHGAFYNGEFKISGVIERTLDSQNHIINEKKYRRGLVVKDEIQRMQKAPRLGISYGYKIVEFQE